MMKARPQYPTDLYGTIYIDNIQKAVVIYLIIQTLFPFDVGSSIKNTRMYDVRCPPLDTWYDISFGVGRVWVLYVNVNENRDIHGNIQLHLRNTTEIPGNLRIGANLDGLNNTAFFGIIACVGFIWTENEPLISELLKPCKGAPWMRNYL